MRTFLWLFFMEMLSRLSRPPAFNHQLVRAEVYRIRGLKSAARRRAEAVGHDNGRHHALSDYLDIFSRIHKNGKGRKGNGKLWCVLEKRCLYLCLAHRNEAIELLGWSETKFGMVYLFHLLLNLNYVGKRHTKSHTLCRRCGRRAFHIQKSTCGSCGYPSSKIRKCKA